MTFSLTYPNDAPPSYEIAIVAGPRLDSNNATSTQVDTTSSNAPPNMSEDSSQQISIRIASRASSRDNLNQSFTSDRGGTRARNDVNQGPVSSRERGGSVNSEGARPRRGSSGERGVRSREPQPGGSHGNRVEGRVAQRRAKEAKSGKTKLKPVDSDQRVQLENTRPDGVVMRYQRGQRRDDDNMVLQRVSQPDIIGQGSLGVGITFRSGPGEGNGTQRAQRTISDSEYL